MKPNKREAMIEQLQLLATGAHGGEVVIDQNSEWPTLTQYLSPQALERFVGSVWTQFFPTKSSNDVFLLKMDSVSKWEDFGTLADAIIEEQKRLKAQGS